MSGPRWLRFVGFAVAVYSLFFLMGHIPNSQLDYPFSIPPALALYLLAWWLGLAGTMLMFSQPRIGAALLVISGLALLVDSAIDEVVVRSNIPSGVVLVIASLAGWLTRVSRGASRNWRIRSVKWWSSLLIAIAFTLTTFCLGSCNFSLDDGIGTLVQPALLGVFPLAWFTAYALLAAIDAVRMRVVARS